MGEAWIRIPKVGIVLGFLAEQLHLAALAASIAVVFVLLPTQSRSRSADAPAG